MAPSCTRIAATIPPSRLWTTWVCCDGTTRPLPRLTSSSTAKCAHIRKAAKSARKENSSIREVRGVRRAAAARMSFAKAKSEVAMEIPRYGCRLCRFGLDRVLLQGGRGWRHRFALQDRQHLVAGSVSDQTAIVKQQQPVDHIEEREAVCRNDDRHPLAANGLQSLQKLGLAPDVEMGCWLIEEQH